MTAVVGTPEVEPSRDGPATNGAAGPRTSAGAQGLLRGQWARGGGLAAAVVVLALLAFCSLAFGVRSLPLRTVVDALVDFDPTSDAHLVVRSMRVPRTAVGLCVGVALGLSGGVMQGITRNPLADPGLLGIEAGASLAVVIGIYWFDLGTLMSFVWLAFLGAAVAGVVVYTLGSLGRGGPTPVKLAVAGAALSSLLVSLTSAIVLLDIDTLDQYRYWVVGSLAGARDDVAVQLLPFIVVGTVLALLCTRALNALALGDDVARSLGQRVGLARLVAALAIVLLCGAATAAAGPITFVGLIVPHVARSLCGPDYRWILPWSMVLAPCLLLAGDVLGRLVVRPAELQVGIVTAFVGAPLFITLVRRRRLAEL
jgi:iron complex transport system permease protein